MTAVDLWSGCHAKVEFFIGFFSLLRVLCVHIQTGTTHTQAIVRIHKYNIKRKKGFVLQRCAETFSSNICGRIFSN